MILYLYKEDLDTFKVTNKEELFKFFLYCYEYSYISEEFITQIKKEIEDIDLPLLNLWLYMKLKYSLFEIEYYPYHFLKNSIEKSIKELLQLNQTKDYDYISDYIGQQLEIIDIALESIGVKILMERPILKLLYMQEDDDIVFKIINKYKKNFSQIFSKYNKYFSTKKFNSDRLLKRKDLDVYQEQLLDYVEIWILYILLIFRDSKDVLTSLTLIQPNIEDFYQIYFKIMPSKIQKQFNGELTTLTTTILKELYSEYMSNQT